MTQTIYLNTDRKQTTPVVHMVQGDTGRELECHITDMVLTGTDSAAIWCERPDGSVWSASGTISNNAATFAFPAGGPLNKIGQVKTQVKITDTNSLVVSTFDLIIEVHENVSGISTPADETWRDGLTASLQADISSRVLQSTKVNGKALTGDITLNASDVPYDNTGSWLTDTDVQDAIDELAGNLRIGSVSGIKNSSTSTIIALNIIPSSQGIYLIALAPNSYGANTGSAYIVQVSSSTPYVTAIHEGTATRAPIIDSSGVLKLVSSSTSTTVYYTIIKIK